MSTSAQSINASEPETGLVYIHLTKEGSFVPHSEETLWFSRDNLPWVIEILEKSLALDSMPDVLGEKRGDDQFSAGLRGDDRGSGQGPTYNLHNRRQGAHAGLSGVGMMRETVEDLLRQLKALQAAGPVSRP